MKKSVINVVLATFFGLWVTTLSTRLYNFVDYAGFVNEHPETSVMTLTVKSVVKSPKKAEELKKDLSGLKGVKDVSVCTTSGTVKISYVKAELGCCSAIHSALKDQGWKYTMVSNEEKPACNKEQSKTCPGAQNKPTSSKEQSKSCSGSQAKACCAAKGA